MVGNSLMVSKPNAKEIEIKAIADLQEFVIEIDKLLTTSEPISIIRTGDNTPIAPIVSLIGIAIIGIVILGYRRKKDK